MAEYVIETFDLSKTYGWFLWKKEVPSLDKLNISIPKGSIFGFLGPNGAGKTTTIRLLMDLIKPSMGSAKVLGEDTDSTNVKEKIGFLPDSPAFGSHLSAYEFLNICGKLLKIPSRERRDRIEEVLDTVKMSQHAKSKLHGFSRGMIQRIGIAQAILNRPELLILDEPLVGLDPHGRQELKDIVLKQKEQGTNVFFCSHILSDIEKICDSVGILNQGQLLCQGSLDDLLDVQGIKATIGEEHQGFLAKMLPMSANSRRLSTGATEIQFNEVDHAKSELKLFNQNNDNPIKIESCYESLEEFFFRKIEASNKELGIVNNEVANKNINQNDIVKKEDTNNQKNKTNSEINK